MPLFTYRSLPRALKLGHLEEQALHLIWVDILKVTLFTRTSNSKALLIEGPLSCIGFADLKFSRVLSDNTSWTRFRTFQLGGKDPAAVADLPILLLDGDGEAGEGLERHSDEPQVVESSEPSDYVDAVDSKNQEQSLVRLDVSAAVGGESETRSRSSRVTLVHHDVTA